jgi:signal transduction histidine kinase
MLKDDGYKVRPVPSGKLALQAAEAEAPDLILLDINMPEMDGYEVCTRLKEHETLSGIPVIFISALTETIDKVKAFEMGGVDYITKPFQFEEVRARVQTHLTLRRQFLELQELHDLRDNLTHMIVHDLRSPLTGIKGYLDLLKLDADKLDEDGQSYINDALSGVKTLVEMISSLLDVNRLESGEMPLNKKDCDLTTISTDAVASLGGLTVDRNVAQESPDGPVTISCDTELTTRVIANLLGNALKFTPSSGDVTVAVLGKDGGARVEVRDTGPGIPPEYLGRVFDKFGQVEARKERKKFSSGLGLAFCKLAVEAHGGTIGVESEVGSGSTFWFELPG